MDKNERIKQAYEWLLWKKIIHKQEDVAIKMKSTQANVSSALKGNPRVLTENFLRRFWEAYMEYFSFEWLIYGTGDMLVHNNKSHEPSQHPAIILPSSQTPNQSNTPSDAHDVSSAAPAVVPAQFGAGQSVPAWADSLIQLVSDNTKAIESMRRENEQLRAELSQLRADLGATLQQLHRPAIYKTLEEPLPLVAESSNIK